MFSLLTVSCLMMGVPQGSARLAVIQKAGNFNLLDQNGATVQLGDLQGRVLLVGFIFTTCNGSCPATTHRMAQVQEELRQRGLLKDQKVRLLSISLDPERDSPDAVRRYIQLYDLDMSTWSFLIGPAERIRSTMRSSGHVDTAQRERPTRSSFARFSGRC